MSGDAARTESAAARQGCREEWPSGARCNAPAEFILWGKLLPAEALGPRCYAHAAKHVGSRALGNPAWAIYDLRAVDLLVRENEQLREARDEWKASSEANREQAELQEAAVLEVARLTEENTELRQALKEEMAWDMGGVPENEWMRRANEATVLLRRARKSFVPSHCGRWQGADGSSGLTSTPLAVEIDAFLLVDSDRQPEAVSGEADPASRESGPEGGLGTTPISGPASLSHHELWECIGQAREPFLIPDVTPRGWRPADVFHIVRDLCDQGILTHSSDGYRTADASRAALAGEGE